MFDCYELNWNKIWYYEQVLWIYGINQINWSNHIAIFKLKDCSFSRSEKFVFSQKDISGAEEK